MFAKKGCLSALTNDSIHVVSVVQVKLKKGQVCRCLFSLDPAERRGQVGVRQEDPQGSAPEEESHVALCFYRLALEGLCWDGAINILGFRYKGV